MALKKKVDHSNVITFSEDTGVEGVSIATTNIKVNDVEHLVSLVGPNRVMYAKANALLKFLKEETEQTLNQKNKKVSK